MAYTCIRRSIADAVVQLYRFFKLCVKSFLYHVNTGFPGRFSDGYFVSVRRKKTRSDESLSPVV